MNIELVSVTRPNLATLEGDARLIANGISTWQENAIEFAGRACYRSTDKMGNSPGFITARVREGHEDIIEHIVVTVTVSGGGDLSYLRNANRHCEVVYSWGWHVSGNLRVWLDFFRKGLLLDALPILATVAPMVFVEFDVAPIEEMRHDMSIHVTPTTDGWGQRVTLLGANLPAIDNGALVDHGSATFFIEGISRACTHQLVRHRMASFSQESQRYVDLAKGEWQAIIPPAIAANEAARIRFERAFARLEEDYRVLREDYGIRKEDARFLLPNAAETRIVVTMNFAAWQHFCWLRAVDKAAQWEIRAMGQQVLAQLYQIAPGVFAEQMEAMKTL